MNKECGSIVCVQILDGKKQKTGKQQCECWVSIHKSKYSSDKLNSYKSTHGSNHLIKKNNAPKTKTNVTFTIKNIEY